MFTQYYRGKFAYWHRNTPDKDADFGFGFGHFFKYFFKVFLPEIYRRLGDEITTNGAEVVEGTRFSDLIVAEEDTAEIHGGGGADVLFSGPSFLGMAATQKQLFDGGRGADTYILGAAEPGEDVAVVQVVFDHGGGRSGASGDKIWFIGFEGDKIDVTDLGNGKILVTSSTDPSQSRIVEVTYDDGSFVSFAKIKASVIEPDGNPLVPGGATLPPTLIPSSDADPDSLMLRGTNLSETFVADDRSPFIFAGGGNDRIIFDAPRVTDMEIDAGSGDDFIYADISGVLNAKISGGAGDDVIVLNERAVPPSQVARFDFTRGDDELIVRTSDADNSGQSRKCFLSLSDDGSGTVTFVLADFGDVVEVTDRADGAVVFRDPATGAAFGTYFCDDDLDLTWAQLVDHQGFIPDFEWITPLT